MDPFTFDLLSRERQRELEAELYFQQWHEQETKAPDRGRGSVRVLFDRARTRFAQVLGSMSAPMLTGCRLRQWRKVRSTGGINEQSPT